MKNNGCPECGCMEVVNVNLVGEGFRSCRKCLQDWWVDIDYTHHANAPQDTVVQNSSSPNK